MPAIPPLPASRPLNLWIALGIPLLTAVCLILLELTDLDMALANLAFDPQAGQFIGRHSYFLEDILHDRAKELVILFAVLAIVGFAALLALTWYTAETLLLLFAGVLFGVFLSALTDLLGRVVSGYHTLRLTLVCALLTVVMTGVMVLGGVSLVQIVQP